MDPNISQSSLISIIVPVYNVSAYLRECLDSILAQTYECYEVILVDDGSTDDSGAICDEYKDRDSRIKVIHKANGGLSSARNSGLDTAEGEYICFVDSDDSTAPDYLEKLYAAVTQSEADFAFCNIESVALAEPEHALNRRTLTRIEAWEWLADNRTREYVLMTVAWNKLYTRALFQNVRFAGGRLHEDEFMINEILQRAERAVYIPDRLYIYRTNAGSITGEKNRTDPRHLDALDAYYDRIQIALDDGRAAFARQTLINGLMKAAKFYTMGGEISNGAKNKYNRLYKGFSNILSIKQRAKYSLFLFAPGIFCRAFVSD